MKTAALISLLSLLPANARAFEPVFIAPGQALYDETSSRSVLSIAVGPYHDGTIEKLSVPGEVRSRSWRFSSGFSGTGSMAEEISAQLHKQGYDVLYSCGSLACGAFDFRFGIDVLLPPNMFVDLSDYFYLSATKDTPKGQAAVSALISRSAQAGLLQIMSAGPASFDDAGETQNGKDGASPYKENSSGTS